MKSAFITMLALAGIACAGEKSAPISVPAIPAPVHSWAVELGGQYNWGLGKFMKSDYFGKKNHMNTVGGDITGVYNLDENQAVTLRFGYTYGGDKFAVVADGVGEGLEIPNAHVRERLHSFTLMPGYRYTYNINERWSVYAGANIGLAAESAKFALSVDLDSRSRMTSEAHKSAWGFAWSVEVGGAYQVAENMKLFAAMTYSGNTARPNIKYASESIGKVRAQQYLGVRAGVSYSF